jgi:transposase
MQPLTPNQSSHILSLLVEGFSAHSIASSTGVSYSSITRLRSKHLPHLLKSSGGRPTKLSPSNICYAQHLIGTGKVENAVQVTKVLQGVINQPLSTQTTCRCLKQSGMKAIVKKK